MKRNSDTVMRRSRSGVGTDGSPRSTRQRLLLVLAASGLAPQLLHAQQQPAKVSRIGYVAGSALATRVEALGQGLREHGYVEGKNIVIEWRETDGTPDHSRSAANEIVRLKVDAIISPGPTVTRVLRDEHQ